MLGVPYVARPSARNEAWMPPAPPAPEVIAQRQIRDEQDAAYQESLLVRPYATCAVNHRSQHALSSGCWTLLLHVLHFLPRVPPAKAGSSSKVLRVRARMS